MARQSIRGTTALRLRHTHPEPPNAAHYAEDDVGEGKSVDVYPPVFGLLRATRAPDRSDDMAHAG